MSLTGRRITVLRRGGVVLAGALVLAASGCGGSTADPTSDLSPGVSSVPSSSPASARPPGPWLAYQAPGGVGDGIFLVHTDGHGAHQILTNVAGEQIHPDWSPTGRELAFIVAEDTQEVWISDADGLHARRVAACTGACLAYDYAAWMPSGRALLMMRYDGPQSDAGVPASSSLELLHLSTGTSHDVSTSAAHELFSAPRVSPDGTSYCVTTEIGDVGAGPTGSAIAVGKLAGGTVRRVSQPRQWGSYCDWRPTVANQIVFTDHDLSIFADMTVSSNLYTVHADGSHRRQLTHFATGKMRATQPRWTPDGTRILVTAVDGDGSLAYRHMASATPNGDHVESATGGQSVIGTHPTLQPST
jgi:Tol biopolymer transport system component